ncbi:DUF4440 domain-containing protein [Vibrio sp. D404a]|uniref:nuclear transport factor 2 family protein n=1 Tax=unclassified Vibrio TaxID=2614977 RepID=UPI002554A59E|nr:MULTISPECIES: nuclear transport factor 2 family protein [unclassified Vibrio]MDK9736000.1 DUF4440 domain-containing protein [Vibrio sp. D404a]MDK9797834.1 DUF4440 domain-containing protein [Vibrio sp. D449a]
MNSIETLMELERESYYKAMSKDFVWLRELHAKNALMFNPGSAAERADDIFAKRIAETGGKPQAPSDAFPRFFWEPTEAFVSASDDMGWVHGVITITHENDNVEYGKYVSVWVKEDGKWKVVAEIRNMNQ